MASLDTNVLVRYLVKDDAKQHAAASRTIAKLASEGEISIPVTVALELEWVLRSCYGVDKIEVINTYTRLLETDGLHFHDEASIERALSLYSEQPADFADCLHVALSLSHDTLPFYSFDKKAAKMPQVICPS